MPIRRHLSLPRRYSHVCFIDPQTFGLLRMLVFHYVLLQQRLTQCTSHLYAMYPHFDWLEVSVECTQRWHQAWAMAARELSPQMSLNLPLWKILAKNRGWTVRNFQIVIVSAVKIPGPHWETSLLRAPWAISPKCKFLSLPQNVLLMAFLHSLAWTSPCFL